MNENDLIEVADKLYMDVNQGTKMDTPNFVYELVERYQREWIESEEDITLYQWIVKHRNAE